MLQEYPWEILTQLTEVLVKKPLLLKHYYIDNKKMHWKTRAILKNNYLSVSGEFIISCIV